MALLRYLQMDYRTRKGRFCPQYHLMQAIAHANQEVQVATKKEVQVREKGKQGSCHQYSIGEHADIGRCVAIHVKAANTQSPFTILHFLIDTMCSIYDFLNLTCVNFCC